MTDFPRGLTTGTGWFTQIEHRRGRPGEPQLVLGITPMLSTADGCPAWLPHSPDDVRALADALAADADVWAAALHRWRGAVRTVEGDDPCPSG